MSRQHQKLEESVALLLWKAGSVFEINLTIYKRSHSSIFMQKKWKCGTSPAVSDSKSFRRGHGFQGTKTPHDQVKTKKKMSSTILTRMSAPCPRHRPGRKTERDGRSVHGDTTQEQKRDRPLIHAFPKCWILNGYAGKEAGCKMYILFNPIYMAPRKDRTNLEFIAEISVAGRGARPPPGAKRAKPQQELWWARKPGRQPYKHNNGTVPQPKGFTRAPWAPEENHSPAQMAATGAWAEAAQPSTPGLSPRDSETTAVIMLSYSICSNLLYGK